MRASFNYSGRQPADHKQRQRALNPATSFIVQAPAGSGKTELLVRRYLALLAIVDAPEQILAITFTRKATAEMRQRIINALNRLKQNGDPEDDPEILAIADTALVNDRRHGWKITLNTRRLRIQTIDAFCSELVARMPWSARFGSAPGVIDDATPLYLKAAQLTLNHIEQDTRWAQASKHLIALVDADWNRAKPLLAGMLEKRDKWMRMLGPANREHLEQMWQQVIDLELSQVYQMIRPEQQAEMIELGAFAASNLAGSGKVTKVMALQGIQHFPGPEYQYIDQWYGIAALVVTDAGTLRKTVNKTQGFPPDRKKISRKNTDPETSDNKIMKGRMLDLLSQIAQQTGLIDMLDKVRLLPCGNFSDDQWLSIEALMQLLPLAAAELRLLFKEQNQADYIELTQRAGMALGDSTNPSDLALAFDYRLKHLLMDEFQDTSTAHIELLAKLTTGWQAGDGRTVFFVGDPMQSIYRFRQAEVANFLHVQQVGLGQISIESITLKANFRSEPQLVDWFNRIFRRVLPQHDDIVNSAVSYASAMSHTIDTQAGNVTLHPGINSYPASEAESIATFVKQAQQDSDQSIAILGRTRRHLYEIAMVLRQREISFQAVDLEKLGDRPAIQDLISITRALAQPADRTAWLSLLRAPWCGMNLADISTLACPDHSKPMVKVWQDIDLVSKLSEEGKVRLDRLRQALTAALIRRGRIGIRQNIEATWLSLCGPATINGSDLDDCHRYLDLLSQMELDQIEISPSSVKKAIDHLWARPGTDAQVQLLTIHKAKGLEFDTVILPGLDRSKRSTEKTLLHWRQLPEQLLIAPLPPSTDSKDPFYKYLQYLDKSHEQNESGRLLYVACTRARKNLHLFGNIKFTSEELKPPASTSLLSLLWPLVQGEYADAIRPGIFDTTGNNPTTGIQPGLLHRLPLEWLPPPLPETVHFNSTIVDTMNEIEFSWVSDAARITGIAIHQILAQVDAIGWDHWSRQPIDGIQKTRWRNRLVEGGIPEYELESALKHMIDTIETVRHDQTAAWIFSEQHRDIKTEWPITSHIDGKVVHVIIDRSFVDENGIRWIIDFKSSRHQGAGLDEFLDREKERHQKQMSLYTSVVTQLLKCDPRSGLYFPDLQGWREYSFQHPADGP